MNDNDYLSALVEDKMNSCIDKYMLTNTNFLDINQQSLVQRKLKQYKNVRYIFFGGFNDCERKLLLFLPDYIESLEDILSNKEFLPIVQLKITKDNFSQLSHRDFLGAIMGLGIKREMLGDLIVTEYGCITVAFRNIAQYIAENLTSVGRGTVKIEISESFDDISLLQNVEEKRCYVSSMRIDAVIASVFNISRTLATEKIKRCEVFVNDIVIEKADSKVPFNSKIVVRGKGKAIIKSDEGITKKGRQAFVADIYK